MGSYDAWLQTHAPSCRRAETLTANWRAAGGGGAALLAGPDPTSSVGLLSPSQIMAAFGGAAALGASGREAGAWRAGRGRAASEEPPKQQQQQQQQQQQ